MLVAFATLFYLVLVVLFKVYVFCLRVGKLLWLVLLWVDSGGNVCQVFVLVLPICGFDWRGFVCA